MNGSGSKIADRISLVLLVAEFGVIVGLLWGLSSEYQSNAFMQTWVTQNAWPLGYLLNGYFAALLLGVLLGSLGIYFERLVSRRRESGRSEA